MWFLKNRISMVIFITVMTIGGIGIKHITDKLDQLTQLSSMVETLKHTNIRLNKENHSLKKTNVRLGKENSSLRSNNKKFKSRNKLLATQNNNFKKKRQKIRKKIRAYRVSVVNHSVYRAEKKLASAGAKMAPFIGIPIIIGSTAMEVNNLCSDIDAAYKLENELFDSSIATHETVCGIDVKHQLKQTGQSIKNQYNDLLTAYSEYNHYATQYWKQKYYDSIEVINEYGVKAYYGKLFK